MARSKKPQRKTKAKPVFYETVPMFIIPAAPMPVAEGWREFLHRHLPLSQIRTQIRNLLRNWDYAAAYTNTKHGLVQFISAFGIAGFATTATLIKASQFLIYAANYAGDAIVRYTPSISQDMRRAVIRAGRTLTGRRARLLYVSVVVLTTSAAIGAGTKVAVATIHSYAQDISSPVLMLSKKKTGTTILDRNGQVLFEGYGAQAPKDIAFSDLPQSLKDATIAAEDPDFYDHPGVSWRAITRAAWVDITHGGRVEGGSTLTQQLVKNTLLTSDKKFERKFQEILLAIQLEQRYSKDQVLEMYLNQIYYGQGSSGVEAASLTYFHKSAHDLTLGESALLAGLPLGPSRFDPNAHLEDATGRRDFVLSRMVDSGKITQAQADAAKAQPMRLASDTTLPDPNQPSPLLIYPKVVHIQAPHFVFYILDQLRAQYGDEIVEQGGITVKTTLDLNKQHLAQQIVSRQINSLAAHHVTNAGLISLEPATGDILTMVGSVDYNTPGFGNVNVTLSQLQPGSSFKPFAYVTAFKKGWTGATHVDDAPMDLPNGDGSRYVPQNYDGTFRGSVSLRRALGNSLNIPAIKVLQFAGIPDTIQTAHDLGITTLDHPERFGLSLVLGGGEVRPIDMATAYATFANGGTRVDPRGIINVSDRYGKDITLSQHPQTSKRVLDPRIAYMITSILSDDPNRREEFGLGSPLKLSRPAAAKTGTTNEFRDNWTVGYTPQLATAVWVGNNDHSPMAGVDGITGAGPIWHEYMEMALAGSPVANFTPPAGVTMVNVCYGDGGLADGGEGSYPEVFLSEAVPTNRCNNHSQPFNGRVVIWPSTPSPTPYPTLTPIRPGRHRGQDQEPQD